MHIINAEEQHIPAIRRIYAHHVLHGTGSFETEPPDTQEMLARVKMFSHVDFPHIALQGRRSSATVISPLPRTPCLPVYG